MRSDLVGVTSVVQSPDASTVRPLGSHAVSFTVRDAAGNETIVQTSVTIAFDRAAPPAQVTVGARTGTAAPGAGTVGGPPAGTVLSAFGPPAIGDFRDMAARVVMLAGRTKLAGIHVEDGAGAGALPAFQGGAAPGIASADVTFKSFLDPVIAPDGTIAFAATLKGAKPAEDQGVWTDAFGPIALVLREGGGVPGFGSAAVKLKSVTSLSLRDGRLLALLKLAPAKGIVTAGKDDVALVELDGTSSGTVLLRTGWDFMGSKIKTIATLAPALGSAGHGRWHADDTVAAKITLLDKRVFVVSVDAGTITVLVRAGEDDPGLGIKLSKLGVPALADGSMLAVQGTRGLPPGPTPDTANELLFLVDPPALVPVLHGGTSTADPNTVFSTFFDPVANAQGMMLFLATIRGNGVKAANKTGLWSFDGNTSTTAKVARLGESAPGKDGLALADAVWSGFSSYALPDGAGAGAVFVAKLAGKAVTAKNKTGLWAADSTGTLRLLLRTNQALTVGAGTKQLASMMLLNAPPGAFGARRSYNSTGSVAVLATFTDKTQAVLRLDVP